MINNEKKKLAMRPYKKRDFKSHKVPTEVYQSQDSLEISSFPLCQYLSHNYGWNMHSSYRVPGEYNAKLNLIEFSLSEAVQINQV